ncbi:polysaccharide deacetylase family protein [Sporolactobacillus putidus]|uniref:Polysaccharide deacetylase family sporulation protein PdaB n=1 Tax=Sporolactobacillus putidus TaxID=492735 RepID=A0A917S3D3_9BACL|nr:polysaccharide deacetylase family protein [Sporolactobacillus putidus]GGL51571.1 polysaccharide deacetylase family sporulation protein PdaB [Sporolactobacillus putidus]
MNLFRHLIFPIAAITLLCCTLSGTAAAQVNRHKYEARGSVVWEVPNDQKVVALTFDDGPNPVYTPQILDLLRKYHAKATFFLIGKRIQAYPDLVKREVREGHELGNHTFSHVTLSKEPRSVFFDEVNKTQALINQYQKPPRIKLLRPPGGSIDPKTVDLSEKSRFEVILWSWQQDPRDWSNPGVNHIVRHVLKNIKTGNIILMHDSGGNRKQTVAALKVILPALEKQGYRFATLYELLKYDKKYEGLYNTELEKMLPESPGTNMKTGSAVLQDD